jgi:hypothetical protein
MIISKSNKIKLPATSRQARLYLLMLRNATPYKTGFQKNMLFLKKAAESLQRI